MLKVCVVSAKHSSRNVLLVRQESYYCIPRSMCKKYKDVLPPPPPLFPDLVPSFLPKTF